MIIFGVYNFIFQGQTQDSKNQQFLLNCPQPVYVGNITLGNPAIVQSISLNYTVIHADTNEGDNTKGKFFDCTIDNITKQPSVSIVVKNYEQTVFNTINTGWYAWFGDTVYSWLDNVTPLVTLGYLFVIGPGLITGLAWFAYINLLLLAWFGMGLFIMIRGGG